MLVLEGSVPNEDLSGEGHWSGFGVDPHTGQPISATAWLDRLAPKAAVMMAVGTCAAYGGVPAMRNNPTGAMGLSDYLGAGWRSRLGVPIVNLPGCPVQPDNITETLMHVVLQLAGIGPELDLDEQGRPCWLFGRTVHDGCNRAGFYDSGDFAAEPGDGGRCLVKLGCSGPVVKCNVPVRGWVNGFGGCPNVGGICMACTMPGFPDKFMPFMDADRLGLLAANNARFAYGPALRYLRKRAIRRKYDVEPAWRRPTGRVTIPPCLSVRLIPHTQPWSLSVAEHRKARSDPLPSPPNRPTLNDGRGETRRPSSSRSWSHRSTASCCT